MPNLIPIPGFSPEDIKRKARSALEKLRDNYDLVSVTEVKSVKPLESTKLVTDFITHINDLHTVEVSADKWNSELMRINALCPSSYQRMCESLTTHNSSSYKGYFVQCSVHDTKGIEYHSHPLQNSTMPLDYRMNPEEGMSANLSVTIQHFDRELDSADHGDELKIKSAG